MGAEKMCSYFCVGQLGKPLKGHNGGQGSRSDSRQLQEHGQVHREHKYKCIWRFLSHDMYSKFQLGIVIVEDELRWVWEENIGPYVEWL